MSNKIVNLPNIPDVDVEFQPADALDLQTSEGFQRKQFVGDIYSNRGRFGGDANFWTIAENDLYATYATAGNLYFRAGKTSFTDTTNGWILGIDSGVPKFLLGGATDSILMSGGDITLTGTIYADAGVIGGWNITDGYIYNLQSGTPTSSPNDGIVMASGNEGIICYEDTAKRLELGYLSAGIYGLKIYDTDGTTVLFETSDTQKVISGWTMNSTTLANSTNIILDASNKAISINSATWQAQGIQLQYNAGTPRAYIGDGGVTATDYYMMFDGTNISWNAVATSLSTAGLLTTTSALIGGWSVDSTSIKDTAGLVGMSSAVTAGDDIRFWAGHTTPASAPFYVTESGALVATLATISGSITATTGAIGGWVVTSTQLADVAGVVGMSSAVTAGDDIRFWAGNVTPASAPFYVTEAGALVATSATISGDITMTSGSIYVGGFPNLPSDTNLAGYWAFNEGSGTVVYDNSPNGNNGTSSNCTIVAGVYGNALSFNGTTSYVQITDNADFQNIWDGGGSVSFWMNASSDGELSSGHPMVKNQSGGWILQMTDESGGVMKMIFQINFSVASGQWTTTNRVFSVGVLHHVVVVYNSSSDANDPTIYVDDVSVAMTEDSAPSGVRLTDVGSNLIIGNNDATTETFDGIIDEVRFYTSTLTANEIRALYLNPAGNTQTLISPTSITTTDLAAISANLGTITAGSISVVSGGNTIGFTPLGTNAIFSGPTGAPTFYVTPAGILTCAGAVIDGTSTLGGRLGSTLASAIDSAGAFINANLDTSAKTILGDFTFGVSGAIKMITDANNGLWLSPTGILGKTAGVNTFTIDILGNATFAGTLSAAAGTLGTITAGTLTGATVQTAASGARVVLDSNGIKQYDASAQRAQILNDGSGWFGSSSGFSWTTAGIPSINGRLISLVQPRAENNYTDDYFTGSANDGFTESVDLNAELTRAVINTCISTGTAAAGIGARLYSSYLGRTAVATALDWNKDIEFNCVASFPSIGGANSNALYGLIEETHNFPIQLTDTDRRACFVVQNTTIYASTANGTNQQSTSLATTADSTEHHFRIVFDAGTAVYYYIDDTLVATHSTYPPTAGGGGGTLPQLHFYTENQLDGVGAANQITMLVNNNYSIKVDL